MQSIDLNGKWTVRQNASKKSIPASVPGNIHTDLLAAGKIEDPFFRDNEERLHWIGDSEWRYSRTFTVPKAVLARDRVLLQCDGLDTLATIKLNGKTVAETDNMFQRWEWDVKALLKTGSNTIEITFASATKEGKRRQKDNALHPIQDGWRIGGGNRIRKEQCNFGWDWGPRCVTCGIWKPIRILAFDAARLSDLYIEQDHRSRKTVNLTTHIEADTARRGALTAEVTVTLNGKRVTEGTTALRSGKGKVKLGVKNPKLWWPNGMGDQPLYEVTVDLLNADGELLDTRTKRIGLRTIKLVRKKDQWGQSFHFAVNGVRFFAKGANWIPTDVFQTRVSREHYTHLLYSARDAHMNMIRVWGGGIYEEDVFYDLCDEMGLLIWQDFMFACAAYPAYDKTFMASVKAEAEDNVRRIRHHPCIALYCGNNELEQCGFVNDTGANGMMKWSDYKTLFDKMLPQITRKLHPEIDYWPSSEHTPVGDRKDTRNPDSGDGHLWNVWHGREPFEWYRTAFHRFCSEFGFQSFPEPKTTYAYTNEEERNVTSHVMEWHQRSGIGNSTIMHYMLSWYRMPVGFDNTLWLSQIQQGLAIKYAVEHWRRNMPRCMGALYWQLNDCWPVASWASIDFPGRWKALHFMAKRFFSPLMITGLENLEKRTVELHVTNDNLKAVNATIGWTLTTVGGKTVAKGSKRVKAKANGNTKADTLKLAKYVEQYGERNLLLWLELKTGGTVVSRDFVTLVRPKHLPLEKPQIASSVKANKDGSFTVTLKAKKPALWAWIELTGTDARYSDNFVCLEPGKSVPFTVTPTRTLSKSAFEKQLLVRSLFDTYQE